MRTPAITLTISPIQPFITSAFIARPGINPATGVTYSWVVSSWSYPIYETLASGSCSTRQWCPYRLAQSAAGQPLPGMSSTQEVNIHGSAGYKRASRKGAPRRFPCEHPGCDKIYSRAEHLQRHQLNRTSVHLPLDDLCLTMRYLQIIPRKSFDATLAIAIKNLCDSIYFRDIKSDIALPTHRATESQPLTPLATVQPSTLRISVTISLRRGRRLAILIPVALTMPPSCLLRNQTMIRLLLRWPITWLTGMLPLRPGLHRWILEGRQTRCDIGAAFMLMKPPCCQIHRQWLRSPA
jgi:hypothetical protein